MNPTMMFGGEVLMPVDLLFGKTSQLKDVSTPEYVHNLTNRMDKVHDIVGLVKLQTVRSVVMITREYKVGDEVVLQDNRKYKGRSRKLQNKWEGPYTITSKISDLLYRIQEGLHTRSNDIHINRLKLFEGYFKRWPRPMEDPTPYYQRERNCR
jgi:hypothetical protein